MNGAGLHLVSFYDDTGWNHGKGIGTGDFLCVTHLSTPLHSIGCD
jgi:hypothetical protein